MIDTLRLAEILAVAVHPNTNETDARTELTQLTVAELPLALLVMANLTSALISAVSPDRLDHYMGDLQVSIQGNLESLIREVSHD